MFPTGARADEVMMQTAKAMLIVEMCLCSRLLGFWDTTFSQYPSGAFRSASFHVPNMLDETFYTLVASQNGYFAISFLKRKEDVVNESR